MLVEMWLHESFITIQISIICETLFHLVSHWSGKSGPPVRLSVNGEMRKDGGRFEDESTMQGRHGCPVSPVSMLFNRR